MSVELLTLVQYLDNYLNSHQIKDYCPNGLQVEGKSKINKIVTGVTASQALIEAAIEYQADALLVHHGYFWRGEDACVVGMKRKRLKLLLDHNISLIAYHLPLDIHPTIGNNAQLAAKLGITIRSTLIPDDPSIIGIQGNLSNPSSVKQLVDIISQQLGRAPTWIDSNKPIYTIGLCTGGGQGYIEQAIKAGVDLYITGEASEQTYHNAVENNISFIAAGHHATERYGVKALGEHIAEHFKVQQQFIDINNPF